MQHKKNGLTVRCLAMAIATFFSTMAWAASVQSVTGSMQGGGEVVRIELTEPLAEPITGFAIQSPARIALDFPGTSNGMGQSLVEIQQGNLSTANVVEASGRTRVVLNLKTATTYRTEINGNSVLVFLDPTKQASAMQPPSSSNRRLIPSSEEQAGNVVLKDIDFRRGSDGAGRLVVNLGSAMVNADVRQEGKGLTIELMKTSLPEGLRRRLDVIDFATPVQTITASQSKDRVRLQVDAKGDWEHSAYQSDSQFVVEVRPKKVDPSKLTSGPGFKGERLSLNFQNIEVRSLLQVIADFTNFNIVTSDTVGGSLTLRLKDVPWDQALNIIMEAKGLGMKKSGNVLWIAPKDEIDERTKRDYESARNIEQLEPLRTQGFQINYAKAEELKKQIADNSGSSEASTRFLSARGSAIAEPRTNQLFVTDTPSKLEEIANLLKKLDVPVRQVLIEARIVEARDTFGRSLGVKFGGGYERAGRGSVGSGYDSFGTSNSAPFVNLPAGLSTGGSASTLALSIFNSGLTRFLSLELSAMEAEGVGKVISSPRLLTADQTQAVIEQGTEYPYTQTAPNGATTVAFKKAVLKLEVMPQITPEGNIILDLDLNKDSRGETTLQGVAIDTKHIKTQVLVENGGTVVIGGIFEMEETNQVSKVPVLGDIPVMGNLFKSRTRESTKREMLVFITPRMVTDAIARN
ncbi:type IV pilus secretin PilQ [Comamonas sp. CMM02]|uniref:Type IV pilus biogenesis and competence protein PilQ n=2 Tax=Comamonas avium TaxID=2762231 RepID=A0ABR8SEA1_9BURK|nr:type IV pilus secretin PilQ [Comamonas avium]MBD9403617.1 type IV pilus secretin PilQ [Comamonas sp. CMM02]